MLLILISWGCFAKSEATLDFALLDKAIEQKDHYEELRLQQIQEMQSSLMSFSANERIKFHLYDQLHQAYFNFDYDSALVYAMKMIETSRQINHPAYIAKAKLSLSTTLMASGIFAEAKDSMLSIDANAFDDSMKVEFYYDCSRLYFDMVDYYQRSYFIESYVQTGLAYLDSALQLTPKGTLKYFSLNGLKLVRTFAYKQALENYDSLFSSYRPQGRQLAIEASTYGFVLEQNGRAGEGMDWLVKAAIEDIKLANKENVALMNLANKLFQMGYIEKSSEYLNVALEDAQTFGALQRKFQISQIQPIVEATKLQITEEQKTRIKRYAFMVTLLSVFIVLILFTLYRQFQKVKAARDTINTANENLRMNNQKLREVNLINEEYIGQFFKTNSDLIEKLDGFRQSVENKLMTHRIDELKDLLKKQNISEERENLYRTFDAVFLNIFPDFVIKFNALFREEDQVVPASNEQMNTDLRIFALIRLGITDTEKIAHILNYSVNTINTYKTKIKNRSVVPNDDFEKEILKIQSI